MPTGFRKSIRRKSPVKFCLNHFRFKGFRIALHRMKKSTLSSILFVIILSISGCVKDIPLKTVRSGDKFLVDIPKSMSEATGLKDNADIQFKGNKEFPLNFYGLSDEKSEMNTMGVLFSLEEIYFLETEEIIRFQNVPNSKVSLPKVSSSSFMNCLEGEVILTRDNKEQVFRLQVCDGGARFYRLVLFGNREDMTEYQKQITDIFGSFREWSEFQSEPL